VLDAAQFGSCAHRLRNFWTNLVSPADMQALCKVVVRDPHLLAASVLEPGREPTAVSRSDMPPYYPCNQRGQPRAAFPTIMAFPRSRSTQPGRAGAIRVLATGESDELHAVERERDMGYIPNTTAAAGVTEMQRRELLGRCIDMNTLSHLFAMASALHNKRQWITGQQEPPLQPLQPARSTPAARQPAAGPAQGLAAMAASAASPPDPDTQLQLSA
jgi:hypothetical protein